jgi:hypothetical protein
MKRNAFFTLAAFCAFPFVMQAQISIGAHAGIHSNNVQIKGIADSWLPENRYWTGAQAGLFVELPLTENLSFQPGLQYIEKGFRVKEGFDFNIGAIPVPIGAEAITRLQYIEMPLLMKYTFGESIIKPYVFAGPHLSYAMDGKVDLRANVILDINIGSYPINLNDDLYNRFEVGGIAGAGVLFETGRVNTFIQASFQHGITDMLDRPLIDLRLRNYGFNLGAGVQVPF